MCPLEARRADPASHLVDGKREQGFVIDACQGRRLPSVPIGLCDVAPPADRVRGLQNEQVGEHQAQREQGVPVERAGEARELRDARKRAQDARTDAEITFLSIVVLLTPGTLVLDVSEDRTKLFVHTMFLDTPEDLCRQVKDGFERRVLELMR